MSKNEYSKHQHKIISEYYHNLDAIMLQKLQELVTELYLCESDKKWEKLWERVETSLVKLKIKPYLIEHIMKEKDLQLLARHIQDWLK